MTDRTCSVDGCTSPSKARGWCHKHYTRWSRWGDPLKEYDGRRNPRSRNRVCSVPDCGLKHQAFGYCDKHAYRFRRYGDPLVEMRVAPEGATQRTHAGYVLQKVAGQWVQQHRHVMSGVLGRDLLPHETVHHINGDRADNRTENLELWSIKQPPGQRVADKVAFAVEILELYAPHLLVGD